MSMNAFLQSHIVSNRLILKRECLIVQHKLGKIELIDDKIIYIFPKSSGHSIIPSLKDFRACTDFAHNSAWAPHK
jgi:hypothetical protein